MAANNSAYQAQNTMTMQQYGLLRYLADQGGLPAGVTIASVVNNGNGTVTVTFQGKSLGNWAAPTPIQCLVGLVTVSGVQKVVITAAGSPTNSSSGL